MKYSWKNRIWYLLAVLMCLFFLFFHVLPLIEMGYQWYYKQDDVYLITGTGLPAVAGTGAGQSKNSPESRRRLGEVARRIKL